MADIVIHGWKLPESCTLCPFFKVTVANAGHGSYLSCLVNNRKFDFSETWVNKKRAEWCQMGEQK